MSKAKSARFADDFCPNMAQKSDSPPHVESPRPLTVIRRDPTLDDVFPLDPIFRHESFSARQGVGRQFIVQESSGR